MKQRSQLSYRDYGTGHPWYYFLGGSVLRPKVIKAMTKASGYKGYLRDEIADADSKAEPARSMALRTLRSKAVQDLRSDLSGYRRSGLRLHRYRGDKPVSVDALSSSDVHTAISLKHNHLVNDFAHLITIDDLLNRQGDLFGKG